VRLLLLVCFTISKRRNKFITKQINLTHFSFALLTTNGQVICNVRARKNNPVKLILTEDDDGNEFKFSGQLIKSEIHTLFYHCCKKLSEIYELNMSSIEDINIHLRNETNYEKGSNSIKIDDANYVISIRMPSEENPLEVMFHELCHVFQMLKGFLGQCLDKKCYLWKGKQFEAELDHGKRPWEQEAMLHTYNHVKCSKFPPSSHA